jgi:hypothetical protein
MMRDLSFYKKANTLAEVDNAIRMDVPITADHPFYTDFSDVRGDFEDRMIYKTLNVHPRNFIYNREINRDNRTLLFLAGMRGSGKTSELAKITQKLHNKSCFFCVTCNLDDGLDLNDMEYMDILIFQLERLFQELEAGKIEFDDDSILASLFEWFSERVSEVNKSIKREGGFEVEVEAKTPSILNFFSLTAKLKSNITGNKENAEKIRTTFRSNFTEFAFKTNEFLEAVNIQLRLHGVAQEILFVVDGMEKTATTDIRRKVVIEEADRIRQIRANMIFTLPIELMPLAQKLSQFSTVVSFPFVKIREKDGTIVEEAVKRFEEFVHRRINPDLFDSPETIREAILLAGGSPRELLRILSYANMYADEDINVIKREDMNKGAQKLANITAQYISENDFELLKVLKESNQSGRYIPFDDKWQDLLEKLIILEYNDGTYKRVNPVVELSPLYKQHVG